MWRRRYFFRRGRSPDEWRHSTVSVSFQKTGNRTPDFCKCLVADGETATRVESRECDSSVTKVALSDVTLVLPRWEAVHATGQWGAELRDDYYGGGSPS